MRKENRFIKNKEFLILLSHCNKKLRTSVIGGCSKVNIYSIIECILNVVNGNIKIKNEEYKFLKPFNRTFKKLKNEKIDIRKKRKIKIKQGGFLQFLIPAIVSGIASIISSVKVHAIQNCSDYLQSEKFFHHRVQRV